MSQQQITLRMASRRLSAIGSALLAGVCFAGTPSSFVVDPMGGGTHLTIQGAIDACVSDPASVISVLPGTYVETIDCLGKAFVLSSSDPDRAMTVIDANLAGPVIRCESGETLATVIDGFTLRNGLAASGGGVRIVNASATVTDCALTANVATSFGGGLYVQGGTAALTGCRLSLNNSASAGGGALCWSASTVNMTACEVVDNTSNDCCPGIFTLGTVDLVNCLLTGNSAPRAGALGAQSAGDIVAINCTIANNTNEGDDEAAGLTLISGANVDLFNCIISGNTRDGIGGAGSQVSNFGSSLNTVTCLIEGGVNGAINADPMFFDASSGDFRLSQNSPAIDAGSSALNGSSTDLAGDPRVADDPTVPNTGPNAPIDLGAFEGTVFCDLTVPTDFATIQGAIDAIVCDGGTVSVMPGTYTQNLAIPDMELTLRAIDPDPANTVLDGGASGSVVTTTGPMQASIEGFTIRNGLASTGGGMDVRGTTSITDCIFESNSSTFRGGALFINADATVLRCTLTGNDSRTAGGVYVFTDGVLGMTSCVVDNNSASDCCSGVFIRGGSGTLSNCRITRNHAPRAGGLGVQDGAVVDAINCTIAHNTNTDSNEAAGVTAIAGADLLLGNTIVYGNDRNGSTGPDAQLSSSATVAASYSIIGGHFGIPPIIVDADPLFVDPAAGDFRLQTGSPAIDAGRNDLADATVVTDLAGNPRLQDDPTVADTGLGDAPLIDLGVYEGSATCPCDINGGSVVDVTDLLDFIALWFAGDPGADYDMSGATDVQDLLAFLVCWFGATGGAFCF